VSTLGFELRERTWPEWEAHVDRRSSQRASRNWSAVTLIAVVGALVIPATAGAAAVKWQETNGGLYTFEAGLGEANTLVITGDEGNYTFTDSVPITDTKLGCTQLSATSLQCPRVQGMIPMNRITVLLAPNSNAADDAPNTFRYDGIPPPPGTPGRPPLSISSLERSSNDVILGSSGEDYIQGFYGVDTISGEGGDDTIYGSVQYGDPAGTYSGGDGNDEIRSTGGGNETMSGGEGDDYLLSGVGVDVLMGDGGNDTLWTYGDYEGVDPAGDKLDGGTGNDALVEEADTGCDNSEGDINIGGPGQDTVYDDCGYYDIFKLKDGDPDKWNCGGYTGVAELDPSDVLVEPKEGCAQGPHLKLQLTQTKGSTAKFRVHNYDRTAILECRLDKAPFAECASETKYAHLKAGKHVFQARGVGGDLIGKTLKYSWKVK
jgi:Ca2+-binding RTX toxin-like protein